MLRKKRALGWHGNGPKACRRRVCSARDGRPPANDRLSYSVGFKIPRSVCERAFLLFCTIQDTRAFLEMLQSAAAFFCSTLRRSKSVARCSPAFLKLATRISQNLTCERTTKRCEHQQGHNSICRLLTGRVLLVFMFLSLLHFDMTFLQVVRSAFCICIRHYVY